MGYKVGKVWVSRVVAERRDGNESWVFFVKYFINIDDSGCNFVCLLDSFGKFIDITYFRKFVELVFRGRIREFSKAFKWCRYFGSIVFYDLFFVVVRFIDEVI